jgi:Zn ribbon nucleic-acid-binding protein
VLGLLRRNRSSSQVDIDLTDRQTEERPTRRLNGFGFPTSCPDCSGRGYLDHLDLVDRTQDQHCVDCGYKWTTTEEALTV